MLYSLFGRVPIVDHTFDLDSSFELQREDMDKVADFIIKDLDEAAALLPIEYNDPNDFGRVTKGAALALKSRVLLYKASPLFGTPSTEKWQAAANAAKAVFDLNKYYLKTVNNSEEYGALFYDVKNPEVIFENYLTLNTDQVIITHFYIRLHAALVTASKDGGILIRHKI